jgi:hypothetical protein
VLLKKKVVLVIFIWCIEEASFEERFSMSMGPHKKGVVEYINRIEK